MSVAACLGEGKLLELVGERLTIGVPDVSLHRELLESADVRKLIERVAVSVLPTSRLSIHFRAIAVTEPPAGAPTRADSHAADIVQSALKMFNAKVIEGRS